MVETENEALAEMGGPATKVWQTFRFETKYQLDSFTYRRVLASLKGRVSPDEYSSRSVNGRYFVRSLYFDTYDYQAYQEKIIGLGNRIKLRMRTYEEHPADFQNVKLEIKCRYAALVGKYSALVQKSDYEEFLSHKCWGDLRGAEADEFRRIALLKDLRPKVLVDYRREAFIPHGHRDMRITFDHNLQFATASELYPHSARSYSTHPKIIVMEIKSKSELPSWLDVLIKQHSLKSVPNSKYAQAIEGTQHGLFRQA